MFNRHHKRKAKRTERKTKRHDRKTHRKDKRVEGRASRQDRRIEGREKKRNQRLEARQKRQLERKWNKIEPDEEQAIASTLPYQDEMKADLQAKGIEIEDANDPIEVATKFVQMNEDTPPAMDDEDYNNAFIDTESDFESNFEYLQKKERGRNLAKVGMGAVAGAIDTYFGQLDEKKRTGQPLSEGEQAVVDAKKEVVKNETQGILAGLFPLIAIAILLMFIFKK